MKKYKVYFADLTHTGMGINSRAFPLGIGCVMANANKELKGHINSELFKFPEDLSQRLSKGLPDILCMSNFAWNLNLSYAFATYVKKVNPAAITIFGGPNFPLNNIERKNFLLERPNIDFYIKWDGEIAFVNLFRQLIELNFDVNHFKRNNVISENCCYIQDKDYIEGPDHRVYDLMSLPSPYLTGLFDKLFVPNLQPWIETTRGCPYSCTFCNDGHVTRNKVNRRSQDFIREELEYIAHRVDKASMLGIADLNFAMYKQDLDTAGTIRSVIKKYNWPSRVETSMGKSQPERISKVVDIINEAQSGALKMRSSLQSTDPEVLKLIKRKNLPFEKILDMENKDQDHNSQTEFFTELILALPGDSKEKHFRSLQTAIDTIGINNIDIHQLILLLGTSMAEHKDRMRFKFDVRHRVYVGCFGLYEIGDEKEDPVAELEETVVGNDTLTYEEYLECRIMNLLIKIFVDHGPFKEVLSFVAELNLSIFGLLIHLRNNTIHKYDSLNKLISSFVEGTEQPLYKDIDYLKKYLTRDVIKKYISGETGGNELLNHKAWAFVNCSTDLHSCLEESLLSYLKINKVLTKENKKFVQEAIKFSQLKQFDLSNIEVKKESEFSFNFVKKQNIEGIGSLEGASGKVKVEFFHDQKTLELVQNNLSFWGTDSISKLGKFYQKSNLSLFDRKATISVPE